MKFSILALGAAVAGISSQCAAQLNIESSFPRAPEARLVSQQEPVGSSLLEEPVATNDDSTYFAPTPPQAEITRERMEDSQSILLDQQSQTEETAAVEEPAGKPVNKKIVAGAPMHVLQVTPEVGMVPVCWQNAGGCPTPNPIADYMTQVWCANGVWDGYACQRARQCAHIQQQMFGHNRYTCGGCASCGTAGVAVGHARPACTSCASSPTPSVPNKAAGKGNELAAPAQSLMAATPAPQSPLLGEFQVGLPVIDLNQMQVGTVPPSGYGQPAAQLTTAPATNRLPNGQPLLQLPADVPTVPQGAVAPAVPSLPSVMPALPVPSNTPVVASRPSSASLR